MREDRLWPAILVLIWLVSAAVWLTPGLTIPDGAGYYVYLPSTYFDRDLLFFDEWQEAGLIRDGRILHKEVTLTDHLGNHWTVGPALFWYPAFLLGDGLGATLSPLQRFGRNGFSLPYNVPVALSSAVAGLIALLCGYRVSKPLVGPRIAALAAAGIWFGTPLMWYSLRNGVMSHAISAMACALAFVVVMRLRDKTDWRSWMLAGLVCGFAFVVRPQNAPVLLLPLFLTRLSGPGATAFAGGAALSTLPQLIVSFHLYGNPLAFLWGGGGEPFAALERIWWWEVLLSWYHGLIPWAPVTALSLAGLVLLFRRDRRLALACWFLLLSQWFINAAMERSFWGAYAFGQRRFDNCTIVFLIGLAVLLARLKPLVSVALVAATSLWTLSLFLAAGSLDLNDYYTPTELLNASLEAWRNAKFELLVFVPPRGKALVALLAVATLILWTGLTLLVRRRAVEVASVYLLCISAFLAWCGWNGQRHVDSYTDLIRYNRLPEVKARNADWRVDLLRHEVLYLEKSGRSSEAARARRDFEAAMRKMEN